MTGTLYIVATPIGNLEDVTLRGIRILNEVDIVIAEDTRVTKKLLTFLNDQFPISNLLNKTTVKHIRNEKNPQSQVANHQSLQSHKPLLISYHQHSNDYRKLEILQYIISGKNIALVTDAGTPGISDPGNELISFLVENVPDIKIVPIPGPSAITTSLSVSGLNVNKFVFLGFLPKKKRTKLFAWLKEGNIPFAFYESPKRITKTLEVLANEFGDDTTVFIARELTKIHETLYRGILTDIAKQIGDKPVKGEIVVIVDTVKQKTPEA